MNPSFKGNERTKYGLKCVDPALKVYEQQTKHKVFKLGFIVNPLIPWLDISPDGIAVKKNVDGIMDNKKSDGISEQKKLVEIKSPNVGKKVSGIQALLKIKYIVKEKENFYLREKHRYFFQVQLGMFVCNLKECDFVLYFSCDNSIVILTIKFNAQVVEDYLSKLRYAFADIYYQFYKKRAVKVP